MAGLIAIVILFIPSESNAQILPTKLTVTVIDGLGNVVEGAEVKLYKTEEDYRGSSNPVFTGTSDGKGRVKFKEVESIAYFMEVTKGDMNNNGEGVMTSKLEAKKTNKVNVVIE
ncbi:MAG: carboxypeptidase regulatory-like domain-containing protein [Cyclobacteriaceae bacterium]